MLGLLGKQHRPQRFRGVARSIRADMHQRQALQDRGGFGKGILGGAKQGEEFVEAGTAAASTQVEVGIQGMVALATAGAEIIGARHGNGAEDRGDGGGAQALVERSVATRTRNSAGGLDGGEQGAQAGH